MGNKIRNILLGFLAIVVSAISIVVILPGQVKLEVTKDHTKLYTYDTPHKDWTLGGTEYVHIVDANGNIIAPTSVEITSRFSTKTQTGSITRTSKFPFNISIRHIYTFNGKLSDVTLVPVYEGITVANPLLKNYTLSYQVADLSTQAHLSKAKSPLIVGKTKVDWEKGYKSAVLDNGRLTVIYPLSKKTQTYDVRLYDPPVTEFSCPFTTDSCGFTGGTAVTSLGLYNATSAFSQFYSPWSNTCTECNISFWVNMGNFSSGNAKFYYATNNGSLANERYYCSSLNASHLSCSPEPGYDYSFSPIPKDTWFNVVIFLNYTSGNSTLYVYNASGSLYSVSSGPKVNKTFTTASHFFAVDTGGWNDHFWFTNFTVIDTLGTGGSGTGNGRVDITGGINFTLNSPLNKTDVTVNVSNVILNVTVFNMNISVTGGGAGTLPQILYNSSFTTSPASDGWAMGSWTHTTNGGGVINNTADSGGAAWTQNLNLSNMTNGYNISLNMSMTNFTNAKIWFGTNSGTQDGDRILLERNGNGGTQVNVKHDGGAFGSITVNANQYLIVDIFVNLSAGNVTVCSGGSCWNNVLANSHLTINGSYIAFVPGQNMTPNNGGNLLDQFGWNISNINVTNTGNPYTLPGSSSNSTLNVSFYSSGNVLLYNISGVANGSTVTFNWTGLSPSSQYTWYATIRTERNVLNVTPLTFNTSANVVPGNLTVILVTPAANTSVAKNNFFTFTINVTCTGVGDCGNVNAYLDPVIIQNNTFPFGRNSDCGGGTTCQAWVNQMADDLWTDTVTCGFNTVQPMCVSRWYINEQSNAVSNYHNCYNSPPNGASCTLAAPSNVPFVTDEGGNTVLIMALQSNQTRFELVRNFTNFIRMPTKNNLQCWTGYINGVQAYNTYADLCSVSDSASDASVRILGAYSIACAKQRSGEWLNGTGGFNVDYCADFVEQGKNIWGYGTASHGEVKLLPNGNYFLCNGYNNRGSDGTSGACPTVFQSFRSDYYEIWALADWAEFMGNDTLMDGVNDMLYTYNASMVGGVPVPFGKTARFGSDGLTGYRCDEGPDNCATATGVYINMPDTFRAPMAVGTYLANHPENIPSDLNQSIFVAINNQFGSGNSTFCPNCAKPVEIYANITAGNLVKKLDVPQGFHRYRGIGMWVPIAVRFNGTWTQLAIYNLTVGTDGYDSSTHQFFGTGYMDAYYSTFAIRAIAVASGMMQHNTYAIMGSEDGPVPYNKNGSLVSETVGAVPFYTVNSNPQTGSCLTGMTNTSSCLVTWSVNATGDIGSVWTFNAFATASGVVTNTSQNISITIIAADTTAPSGNISSTVTNETIVVKGNASEAVNMSVQFGSTINLLDGTVTNTTFANVNYVTIPVLTQLTTKYFNVTLCDILGNCNTTGPYSNTTTDVLAPFIFNISVTPLTGTTALFTWTTDELSTSDINMGPTVALGSITLNSTPTIQHRVIATGLVSSTLYYVNLSSTDSSGNIRVNGTHNFTTNASVVSYTFCPGISAVHFLGNVNLFNFTTQKITDYNISALNQSTCLFTISNTGSNTYNFTAKTNDTTTANQKIYCGETMATRVELNATPVVVISNALNGNVSCWSDWINLTPSNVKDFNITINSTLVS